jgi:hypothetical protein
MRGGGINPFAYSTTIVLPDVLEAAAETAMPSDFPVTRRWSAKLVKAKSHVCSFWTVVRCLKKLV